MRNQPHAVVQQRGHHAAQVQAEGEEKEGGVSRQVNVYIPKECVASVKRLQQILESRGVSLSEWFRKTVAEYVRRER